MGEVIAWRQQQQRSAPDELCTSHSEHFVFLSCEEQRRRWKEWTSANRDLTRGWTHMFAGDKGVIYRKKIVPSWVEECCDHSERTPNLRRLQMQILAVKSLLCACFKSGPAGVIWAFKCDAGPAFALLLRGHQTRRVSRRRW